MAQAIASNACHGVGLGRPLAAEPYLCRDLLSGRVSGALENFAPMPQITQSSGTQIHQIGKGETAISDFSDEAEVARWVKAFKEDSERRNKILPKVDSSGYPWLKATAGFEYLK